MKKRETGPQRIEQILQTSVYEPAGAAAIFEKILYKSGGGGVYPVKP